MSSVVGYRTTGDSRTLAGEGASRAAIFFFHLVPVKLSSSTIPRDSRSFTNSIRFREVAGGAGGPAVLDEPLDFLDGHGRTLVFGLLQREDAENAIELLECGFDGRRVAAAQFTGVDRRNSALARGLKTSPSAAAVLKSCVTCCLNVVEACCRRVSGGCPPGPGGQGVEAGKKIRQAPDGLLGLGHGAPRELQLLARAAVLRTGTAASTAESRGPPRPGGCRRSPAISRYSRCRDLPR